MTSTSPDLTGVLEYLDDADPALYGRLLRDARTSGRSPVRLGAAAPKYIGLMDVPTDPASAIAAVRPERVLSTWSPSPCPPGCRCLEPFTDGFPSQLVRADGTDRSQRPETIENAVDVVEQVAPLSRLALVDAARPADIPAVLGWAGACNYDHQDLASICAVLRSWEERFGAVVVTINGPTLLLAVADPPTSRDESERVASEHFAFCPDQHDPQNGTVYTPRTYARTITGKNYWRFWWD